MQEDFPKQEISQQQAAYIKRARLWVASAASIGTNYSNDGYGRMIVLHFEQSYTNINIKQMRQFSNIKWSLLRNINFSNNRIGNLGCKLFSQADIPKLSILALENNNIDSVGVFHLSKMGLIELHQFSLSKNQIGYDGITWLNKSQFEGCNMLNAFCNKLTTLEIMKWVLNSMKKPLNIIINKNTMVRNSSRYLQLKKKMAFINLW